MQHRQHDHQTKKYVVQVPACMYSYNISIIDGLDLGSGLRLALAFGIVGHGDGGWSVHCRYSFGVDAFPMCCLCFVLGHGTCFGGFLGLVTSSTDLTRIIFRW